ncbi:Carnitine O-acetyltransferase mitochondrial, partial [Coemansia nantahalensis]
MYARHGRQLQDIIDSADGLDRTRSVGVLTAAHRDDWHAARECLLQTSPANARSLRMLESAALLVSLETSAPATHAEFSLACHCGDGASRYFDKNFQLLVFANGRYGFNGEHSLTDATTDMRLCNVLIRDVEAAAAAEMAVPGPVDELASGSDAAAAAAEELSFVYTDELLGHIQNAVDYFDAQVAAHEMSALGFDSFGK